MSCYGSLAGYYDKLTGDVPYSKFIEFYEAEFARDGGEFRLLLDLCCGHRHAHLRACAARL